MYSRNSSYNVYRPASRSPAPRKRVPSAHIKLLLLLALVVGLVFHSELVRRASAEEAARAESAQLQAENNTFRAAVLPIIEQYPELNIAVAAAARDNSDPIILGDHRPQDAASTAKLLTASAFLHKVEKGQASLNYRINSRPASTELRLLINQSDDSAWEAFNAKIGHAYLDSYARSLGLSSYSSDNNRISSRDLVKLASLLGSGKLLNPSHTKLLLSYMQNTNYEDFMSPAILPGVKLYHKVGINGDQVNDVGVIRGPSGNFSLSVMTNGHGSYNWPARAKLIQQITKAAESAYL